MINLTREEAQQVLDALINAKGYIFYNVLDDKGNRYDAAADILRAKLSEPEPEPVAVVIESHEVGGVNDLSYYQEDINALPMGTKLYTTPPQRESAPTKLMIVPALLEHAGYVKKKEWVGLTDEEYTELWGKKPDLLNFFRKIEAKLKEKNNV